MRNRHKRVNFIFSSLLATIFSTLIVFSACSREEQPKPQEEQNVEYLIINASAPNTKSSLNENGQNISFAWEPGDIVHCMFVQNETGSASNGVIETINSNGSARLKIRKPEEIKSTTGKVALYAYYCGETNATTTVTKTATNAATTTGQSFDLKYEQKKVIANLPQNVYKENTLDKVAKIQALYGKTEIENIQNPKNVNIPIKNLGSIMRISIENIGNEDITGITKAVLKNDGNDNFMINTGRGGATYDLTNDNWVDKKEGSSITATFDAQTIKQNEKIVSYVWIIPGAKGNYGRLDVSLHNSNNGSAANSNGSSNSSSDSSLDGEIDKLLDTYSIGNYGATLKIGKTFPINIEVEQKNGDIKIKNVMNQEKYPVSVSNGFSFYPSTINPNRPLTIIYKPDANLENPKNLYLHTGANANWTGSGEWNNPDKKYKLTKEGDHYIIKLTPSVKKFYGLPNDEQLLTLNLIVHEVKEKGRQTKTYTKLIPDVKVDELKEGPSPIESGADDFYGIHLNGTEATLILRDCSDGDIHHKNAFVLCEGNNFIPSDEYKMTWDKNNKIWHHTLTGLKSGDNEFQYMVVNNDGSISYLVDPYCKKAHDKWSKIGGEFPKNAGGNLTSIITVGDDFNWTSDFTFSKDAQKNMVIYEMLIRDFTKEGTLKAAQEKLDYLQNLGINAIELMPVQEFGGDKNWGYDTSLYFALDRAYGEPEDYKTFIDECHKRNIAVIFDVVYNHSNGNNPFAIMYPDYSNNPYFYDVKGKNYALIYSDEDFDHTQKITQDFFKRNLKFLSEEYKIDGFRFDCTKGFVNGTEATYNNYNQTRVDILRDYNSYIKKNIKSNAVVIMEHLFWDEEEKLAGDPQNPDILCWKNMNDNYCQSAMGYKERSGFGKNGSSWGDDHWGGMYYPSRITYMESHDEPRMAWKQKKYGTENIKSKLLNSTNILAANAAFTLCVPGPKMLWQFCEFGFDKGNAEEEGTGGRCDPVAPDWSYLESAERKNLYDIYSYLMYLRNNYSDLFQQSKFYWEASEDCWDAGRSLKLEDDSKIENNDNKRVLLVLANFTGETKNVHFIANSNGGNWQDLLKNEANEYVWPGGSQGSGKAIGKDGNVSLEPYSFAIFGRFLPTLKQLKAEKKLQ